MKAMRRIIEDLKITTNNKNAPLVKAAEEELDIVEGYLKYIGDLQKRIFGDSKIGATSTNKQSTPLPWKYCPLCGRELVGGKYCICDNGL